MPDANTPPPVPDDKRLFLLLRKVGLGGDDAYTFVQELHNMAAANLIARFESKLDTLASELALQREQLRRERSMLWVLIGILGSAVVGGLAALVIQSFK